MLRFRGFHRIGRRKGNPGGKSNKGESANGEGGGGGGGGAGSRARMMKVLLAIRIEIERASTQIHDGGHGHDFGVPIQSAQAF